MKIYLPFYDRGWHVQEVETKESRYFHTPGYVPNVMFKGTLYSGLDLFKTELAAWDWIHQEKVKNADIIEPENCEWKELKDGTKAKILGRS